MADDPYARIAELEAENAALRELYAGSRAEITAVAAERDVALEHQSAIAEVLGIIASSSGDPISVLGAIASTATHLTASDGAIFHARDGDGFSVLVAHGKSASRAAALVHDQATFLGMTR
jgi:hypothetical protein